MPVTCPAAVTRMNQASAVPRACIYLHRLFMSRIRLPYRAKMQIHAARCPAVCCCATCKASISKQRAMSSCTGQLYRSSGMFRGEMLACTTCWLPWGPVHSPDPPCGSPPSCWPAAAESHYIYRLSSHPSYHSHRWIPRWITVCGGRRRAASCNTADITDMKHESSDDLCSMQLQLQLTRGRPPDKVIRLNLESIG